MTDPDLFLGEAAAFGDRLVAEAFRFRDRATWVSRAVPYSSHSGKGDRYPELMALNSSVYSGTAGVALFLARLAAFTDDPAHRSTARAALEHAVRHAWWRDDGAVGEIGGGWRFGFYLGTLGIAWTAHEAAPLLEDESLDLTSRRLLRELGATLDLPFADDVIFGAAGAIPALLSISGQGAQQALDLAVLMGEHLLVTANRVDDRLSWGANEHPDLTGFSHGTAGIGAGLLALHAATGDDRFLEAGTGAFAYEDHHFDREEGNWPNFQVKPRADGRYPCSTAWCHGAPGIGVARALAHTLAPSAKLRDDVTVAAETTRLQLREELVTPGRDLMLCHGTVGNLEALWLMEEALGDPTALDRQREAGRHLISLYGTTARLAHGATVEWPSGVSTGIYPTLVTGVVGVAHWLLRLHAPDAVPTVLAPGVRSRVAEQALTAERR